MKYSSETAVVASPVVHDGAVYAGRDDGNVLALDADVGSLDWLVECGSPVYADLTYLTAEDLVYVGAKNGSIYALDAADGTEAWSRTFSTDISTTSAVVDDERELVYFASNEVVALSTASGEPSWATNFFGATAGSSPVFDEEYVYVAGASGRVYAVANDGRIIHSRPEWEYRTESTVVSDPIVIEGSLIVPALNGSVYVLAAPSGEELDRADLPCETRSSPVVVDDELYIGSRSGTVYSFEYTTE